MCNKITARVGCGMLFVHFVLVPFVPLLLPLPIFVAAVAAVAQGYDAMSFVKAFGNAGGFGMKAFFDIWNVICPVIGLGGAKLIY